MHAATLLLNQSDSSKDVGMDFLLNAMETCPHLSEDIFLALLDEIEKWGITQTKVSVLQVCVDQLYSSSFDMLVGAAVKRHEENKTHLQEANLQLEQVEQYQMGEQVEILLSDGRRHSGTVVKVNAVKKELSIEYEDIDNNGNPLIQLEVVKFESAAQRLRSMKITGQSLANETAATSDEMQDSGDPRSNARLSLIELLNQFDRISKIVSIIYLQVRGSSEKLSLSVPQWHLRSPVCSECATEMSLIPSKAHFRCNLCQFNGKEQSLAYRWQCSVCLASVCTPCTSETFTFSEKALSLTGDTSCPIFATKACLGEPLREIAPGEVISVRDHSYANYYSLSTESGFISKTPPAGSSWTIVSDVDVPEMVSTQYVLGPAATGVSDGTRKFSTGYLALLLKSFLRIDKIRKELVITRTSGNSTVGSLEEDMRRARMSMLNGALSMLKNVRPC